MVIRHIFVKKKKKKKKKMVLSLCNMTHFCHKRWYSVSVVRQFCKSNQKWNRIFVVRQNKTKHFFFYKRWHFVFKVRHNLVKVAKKWYSVYPTRC